MSDRKPRKWEVSRMYGGWEAVHPSSERAAFFRTFAEAIAYADRRARTHPVYVPPVGKVTTVPEGPDSVFDIVTFRAADGWIHITREGRGIVIPPSQQLPLARVLLAHHGKAHADGR